MHSVVGVQLPAGAAGVDQDAGQRDQPREPLRTDRGIGLVPVAVDLGRLGPGGRGSPIGRRARGRRGRMRFAGVALDQQSDPLAQLLDELGWPENAGVLAQAEHPRDQLPGVGIGGAEDAVLIAGDRRGLDGRISP